MVNYPNGRKMPVAVKQEKKKTEKPVSFSRRGMSLEDDLNETNSYYLSRDIAAVYKKPTPVTIVKVDYAKRSTAKITEAYFQLPSTTDYNGVYKGLYLDFEAKETHSKTSMPLSIIHPHQITHLERVVRYGGVAFMIVRFAVYDETYYVKANVLLDYLKVLKAKSIKYEWFKENGILIPYSFNIKVDYLKVVDQLMEERK